MRLEELDARRAQIEGEADDAEHLMLTNYVMVLRAAGQIPEDRTDFSDAT